MKLAPHRPTKEEKKGEKFSPFSGHHATARKVAKETGVSWRTIHADAPKGRKMYKICTFSLRRNLTDSQRTEVIGRIYNTLKQNPVLNLKQFQSGENGEGAEDREEKFTSRKGSDATARAVAKATGVSEKTVRNAGKFAEAVAALERISPKAEVGSDI
jgi:hypothetical protein